MGTLDQETERLWDIGFQMAGMCGEAKSVINNLVKAFNGLVSTTDQVLSVGYAKDWLKRYGLIINPSRCPECDRTTTNGRCPDCHNPER